MVLYFKLICYYFGIFCHEEKPSTWNRSVKTTDSYLTVSAQLLAHIVDSLMSPSDYFNETTVWNPAWNFSKSIDWENDFNDEDKLAVIQIVEKLLLENQGNKYRAGSQRNKSKITYVFKIDEKSNNNKTIIKNRIEFYKTKLYSNDNNSTRNDTNRLKYIENGEQHQTEPIESSYLSDIFFSRYKIEKLVNDSTFNAMLNLLEKGSNNEETTEQKVEPSLMFDEVLQFLSTMQEFFEQVELNPSPIPFSSGLKNRVKIDDIIRVLNFSDTTYTTLTVDSYLKGDTDKDIINVDNLIESLKYYNNTKATDKLAIKLKIQNDNREKHYNLSSIVQAILKEEKTREKSDASQSVTIFGTSTNYLTVVSKSNKISSSKIPKKNETDALIPRSVRYILSKLRDLLYTECKVRNQQNFQSFSSQLHHNLTGYSFNSSAQQLRYYLSEMIERKDSVWTPAIMLSDFILDETKLKDSFITLALSDVDILKYS